MSPPDLSSLNPAQRAAVLHALPAAAPSPGRPC